MAREKSKKRHDAIRELISTSPIGDQETLIEQLKKQYGITTSQAVISRDLRALGVSKRSTENSQRYELFAVDASREILRLAIVDITHNEHLIVIKTLPGLAAFVADFIDLSGDPAILGTLAGENVVFVVPSSVKTIKSTVEALQQRTEFISR